MGTWWLAALQGNLSGIAKGSGMLLLIWSAIFVENARVKRCWRTRRNAFTTMMETFLKMRWPISWLYKCFTKKPTPWVTMRSLWALSVAILILCFCQKKSWYIQPIIKCDVAHKCLLLLHSGVKAPIQAYQQYKDNWVVSTEKGLPLIVVVQDIPLSVIFNSWLLPSPFCFTCNDEKGIAKHATKTLPDRSTSRCRDPFISIGLSMLASWCLDSDYWLCRS